MAEKLDTELRRVLGEIATTNPGARIPVIVTLKPGAKPAEVIPGTVDHEFEAIAAASTRLTAKQILDLSRHRDVEKIEHDGEMRALRALAGAKD